MLQDTPAVFDVTRCGLGQNSMSAGGKSGHSLFCWRTCMINDGRRTRPALSLHCWLKNIWIWNTHKALTFPPCAQVHGRLKGISPPSMLCQKQKAHTTRFGDTGCDTFSNRMRPSSALYNSGVDTLNDANTCRHWIYAVPTSGEHELRSCGTGFVQCLNSKCQNPDQGMGHTNKWKL